MKHPRRRTYSFLAVLLILMLPAGLAQAQTESEQQGVHDAVLDYLEALYNAQPERIERSVSPELVKFGWWRQGPTEDYRGSPMTYDQLYALAGSWNVDNRQEIDEDTPSEIVVLDVLDQTAAAKLTAAWGIDYFQLEKVEGKWMIRHVLWQSHPQS